MTLTETVYRYMIFHARWKKEGGSKEARGVIWFSDNGINWETKPEGYQFEHDGYTMEPNKYGGMTSWKSGKRT